MVQVGLVHKDNEATTSVHFLEFLIRISMSFWGDQTDAPARYYPLLTAACFIPLCFRLQLDVGWCSAFGGLIDENAWFLPSLVFRLHTSLQQNHSPPVLPF